MKDPYCKTIRQICWRQNRDRNIITNTHIHSFGQNKNREEGSYKGWIEPRMDWDFYHKRSCRADLCKHLLLMTHIKYCKYVIWFTEDIAWLFHVNFYDCLPQCWQRFRLKCGQLWGGGCTICLHLPSLCSFSLRCNLTEKWSKSHVETFRLWGVFSFHCCDKYFLEQYPYVEQFFIWSRNIVSFDSR